MAAPYCARQPVRGRSSPRRHATRRLAGELLEPRWALDSTVVFNELMHHPAGNEADAEGIELCEQMAIDFELSGWKLRGGVDFDFPAGTILGGGEFLVVASDSAALALTSGHSGALGPMVGRPTSQCSGRRRSERSYRDIRHRVDVEGRANQDDGAHRKAHVRRHATLTAPCLAAPCLIAPCLIASRA